MLYINFCLFKETHMAPKGLRPHMLFCRVHYQQTSKSWRVIVCNSVLWSDCAVVAHYGLS